MLEFLIGVIAGSAVTISVIACIAVCMQSKEDDEE